MNRRALFLTAVLLAACARQGVQGGRGAQRWQAPSAPALHVVMPLASPPYSFAEGGELVGLEVDFAAEIAAALGRPLSVEGVEFNEVLPTLIAGRADMAMGGFTVTPARAVQVAFAEPYVRSGLLVLLRREDAAAYPTPASVVARGQAIGVVQGTTGERFVNQRVQAPYIRAYPTAPAAVDELRTRRIDAFVHDAPVVIWFASRDEANFVPILKLLGDEPLAWAVGRGDTVLQGQVNALLARWRADGTRDRILARWLPYWQRLEAAERTP